MNMLKKITLRLVLLIAMIPIFNCIYKATTYSYDLRKGPNVLTKFQKAEAEADVLYFSSSPNAMYSDMHDTDRRSIAQMVDDSVDLKVIAVDTGAIHAGVFKKLIQLIPKNSTVKKVIVHLNYRSFGINWIQSELENAIQREMTFYTKYPPLINRFLQGLNAYAAIPNEERNEIMLSYWEENPLPFAPPRHNVQSWCAVEKWGDWKNPKRNLADHYIKNYAFTLTEDNPRLQDYDAITAFCNAADIELYYVILPENLEQGEALVDRDLIDLMIANKNFLKERYTAKGVHVIDDFDLLSDTAFIERTFPSEHYFEDGRRQIARSIIHALQ